MSGGPTVVDSNSLFENRKVVVFAITGAFTGTCQLKQTPTFVENFDKFKVKYNQVLNQFLS